MIIISIWFPINSINQWIEIVSWNVNILKDESVRKGEVLVMVVEDKLSSVGPVDQTIINIITPTLITTTQHHITPPQHHGNTYSWWGSWDECRNQFVQSTRLERTDVWASRWRYQIILVNQEGNFRSLSSLSTFTLLTVIISTATKTNSVLINNKQQSADVSSIYTFYLVSI